MLEANDVAEICRMVAEVATKARDRAIALGAGNDDPMREHLDRLARNWASAANHFASVAAWAKERDNPSTICDPR